LHPLQPADLSRRTPRLLDLTFCTNRFSAQ
jgi:hypothetical protein